MKCSICSHAKRAEAEQLIASGVSVRQTAKTLALSYQSLDRHQRNCARQAIAKAIETRESVLAERLVEETERLYATTTRIMEQALAEVDGALALKAIAQARRNLELVARLAGKLDPKQDGVQRTVTFEEFEALYLRVTRVKA